MKTITLLFTIFAGFQCLQAAILTVNNNNPSPGQFTTIHEAYAASSSGDTIYVNGSSVPYVGFPSPFSPLLIDLHPVVIIGTGFNPGNATSLRSTLGTVMTVDAGGSGTKFIGLTFNQGLSSGGGAANIIVDRCAFPGSTIFIQGNNWEVSHCFFGPLHTEGLQQGSLISNFVNPVPDSVIFKNNIFIAGNSSSTSQIVDFHFSNITFSNNVFIHTGLSNSVIPFRGGSSSPLVDAIFQSNIFIGINPLPNCSGCTYNHNLSFVPLQITGTTPDLNAPDESSNNIVGDPLFTAYPLTTVFNDYNLLTPAIFNPTLQANSPAMTAGPGGVQIGPFGGIAPFLFSGEPDLPVIRQFSFSSPMVPVGTTLQVFFTVTPNN